MTSKSKPRRLQRSADIFEFIVDYPHGTSALAGYRKAARHFGWRTREDPTLAGGDQWRLLIGRDDRVLREAVRRLSESDESHESEDEDDLFPDMDILLDLNVHWIAQDWKYWDMEAEAGAMESLGWTRSVVPHGKRAFRVTLRLKGRRKRRGGRPEGHIAGGPENPAESRHE
jgi:hypothetical protein